MSTMQYDVYDAFKAAGVPEDKARKAAEALADSTVDRRLLRLELMVGGLYILVLILLVPMFMKIVLGS